MYGHFNLVIRSFVIERQGGEATWERIVAKAKCEHDFEDNCVYAEQLTDTLITLAIDILGFPREPLLEMLGEYYLVYLRKKGYDEILRNMGSNILEFLQNLDSVHAMSRRDFPEMIAPSFRCDDDASSDRMVLHYYSYRKGMYPIVKGLATEAAKAFFKMQLQMDVQKIETVNVASVNGEREHVTFDVVARKIQDKVTEDGPPTFLAQTKKNSEKQILQEDVEAVKKKLEQIQSQLGEGHMPLKKKTPRGKWRMAAKITAMHRGFVPNYPQTLSINPRMFIEIFPYHLIIDTEMTIVQSGIKIQILMNTIRTRDARVADFFTLRYPNCVDLTYRNVENFISSPFILELKRDQMGKEWVDRPPLQIKGQMIKLRDSGFYVYMASPVAKSWSDLEHRTLKMADIPMWDVTRDFLVSDLLFRNCLQNNQCVIEGDAPPNSNNTRLSLTASGRGGNEAGVLKDKLQRLQKDLDNERNRTDSVYQAFLPREIAELAHRGQIPTGEFYQQATALFCDVVQFLPMVAKCSPSEVVGILNTLHTKFDHLTSVHCTFKVESIGDAYLVIAGVGEKRDGHAERIANTALAMTLATKDIRSPLHQEQTIMIRTGIHTGSIVTGVIGSKLPRFVVMGETPVVASKLESSSDPGRIQISPTTHRLLQNKGYVFENRGQIELRGLGMLETYYLAGNQTMTEEDLLGKTRTGNQDITFINEGKMDVPFEKRNKIFPANGSPSSGVGSRPPTGDSDRTSYMFK